MRSAGIMSSTEAVEQPKFHAKAAPETRVEDEQRASGTEVAKAKTGASSSNMLGAGAQ